MNHYRDPFKTVDSRKPVWVWPNEIPINGKPADVNRIVIYYNRWLRGTELPKLLFYAHHGRSINPSMVEWKLIMAVLLIKTIECLVGLTAITYSY